MLCSSCVFCFFFCACTCVEMSVVLSCYVLRYHYITEFGWAGGGEAGVADSAHVRCQCGNQVDHRWWNMSDCVISVASWLHEHFGATSEIFLKRLCSKTANLEKGLTMKEPEVYNNLANIVSYHNKMTILWVNLLLEINLHKLGIVIVKSFILPNNFRSQLFRSKM